jgi:hypothetical protein
VDGMAEFDYLERQKTDDAAFAYIIDEKDQFKSSYLDQLRMVVDKKLTDPSGHGIYEQYLRGKEILNQYELHHTQLYEIPYPEKPAWLPRQILPYECINLHDYGIKTEKYRLQVALLKREEG